ncbi:MAG: hypothetical protein PHQ61_06520 [Candidatus Omnitrophica bacterium]|nr:hypothetical protein [Candidatus Omnitrophota bacterium]
MKTRFPRKCLIHILAGTGDPALPAGQLVFPSKFPAKVLCGK